jgi:hypothetical protein
MGQLETNSDGSLKGNEPSFSETINNVLDIALEGCTDPLEAFRRGYQIGRLMGMLLTPRKSEKE